MAKHGNGTYTNYNTGSRRMSYGTGSVGPDSKFLNCFPNRFYGEYTQRTFRRRPLFIRAA